MNALPVVTCPANSSVCISASAFTLTGGSPAGGSYSGTGVSGGQFDPAAAGVGSHTITYSYTNATTGCSNSCTFTITVNPLPSVSCPANSTVCINAAAFTLTGGTPTGGTYSGTGVSGGQFNPASAGAGTHTITYSYTDGNGCTNSCTFTITVNALPVVTCPANSTICISAPAYALTGGSPTGGTYSGTGVSGGQFDPAAAGAGSHTITYSYTDPSTGCSNSCTFIITVVTSVTITATAGPNGTITPSGTTAVSCGGSQTYTIAANTCYSIADVLVNGVSVGPVSSYTFTNVNTNQTISATFVINGPYTIVASSGPNGSVTPPGTTTVTCGDRVTYTITPDPCYLIADVLVDGVSNPGAVLSGTYTFNNVTANHTISATFVLAGPFTITATSGSNGTVTPPGVTTLPCGGSQSYSIIPNPGFIRSTVLIDGVNNPGAVSSGSYTFSNVQMNHTIHATFVTACSPTTVTITASMADFCSNPGLGIIEYD